MSTRVGMPKKERAPKPAPVPAPLPEPAEEKPKTVTKRPRRKASK